VTETRPDGGAIRVRGLAKNHAGEHALKGVDLDVAAGTLFGVIGADGAGKSTLLTVLATLMDADAGEASVLGFDLKRDFRAIRRSLAFMPQRFSLYPDLTVLENLDFFADLYDLSTDEKKKRKAELLAFSGLEPFGRRKAGQLSGGMKQKLALSCCLLHRPRLLLLDEPTVGVDPVARRDFWNMLKSLQPEGITLLVSTPYMDEAELCDELLLMHQGKMLATGSPGAMLKDYPYALWSVSGPKPLSFPAEAPLPHGATLAYPSGGSLRVAFEPGRQASGSVEGGEWWRFFPGAAAAAPRAPDIEDLFFALLSRESDETKKAAA
jgi:ABC-2 type transport system ATP-binding protein